MFHANLEPQLQTLLKLQNDHVKLNKCYLLLGTPESNVVEGLLIAPLLKLQNDLVELNKRYIFLGTPELNVVEGLVISQEWCNLNINTNANNVEKS